MLNHPRFFYPFSFNIGLPDSDRTRFFNEIINHLLSNNPTFYKQLATICAKNGKIVKDGLEYKFIRNSH